MRKATFPNFLALCSADAYPLRPAEGVDPNYLNEVLLSERFAEVAIGRSGRTKMPKVNRRELMSIPVPGRPSEEQRAVGQRLHALRRMAEEARSVETAARHARSVVIGAALTGAHHIPTTYDRFLDGVA